MVFLSLFNCLCMRLFSLKKIKQKKYLSIRTLIYCSGDWCSGRQWASHHEISIPPKSEILKRRKLLVHSIQNVNTFVPVIRGGLLQNE